MPTLLVQSFLQHLQHEETLLREALAITKTLYTALVAGDLGSAQNSSLRQETLAAALQEAAHRRAEAAVALAREVGFTGSALTLSALAARLPEPLATEVIMARDRLAVLTAELTVAQTRNANLLHHLRSYLRGVLSDADSDVPVRYGPSGARIDAPVSLSTLRERATA
ncbi:MAG: flagellar export chaperone FlgN [Gemmataceae bacterium]|nr:flagellar export chaperone FlgN [Gemmata sp.]MDW8197059.1 flagellar export chaperone FlgN [Gemmataceae bacterium]